MNVSPICETKRIIHNFAKEVGSPSAVDRTDYGTASGSARGFVQHHSQQLSRAAVCGDAQNINNAARNMSLVSGVRKAEPQHSSVCQLALLTVAHHQHS